VPLRPELAYGPGRRFAARGGKEDLERIGAAAVECGDWVGAGDAGRKPSVTLRFIVAKESAGA